MDTYNREFQFNDGLLTICLTGTFPKSRLGKGDNLFQPLINACEQHNCRKVLVDARNLAADLGTLGLFQAGENAATLAHRGLHVAFLVREDMVDDFFENVVVNRSGIVGVFAEMDAAHEWLRSQR